MKIEPAFLAGKSGIEIAVDIVLEQPESSSIERRDIWDVPRILIGWAVCITNGTRKKLQ